MIELKIASGFIDVEDFGEKMIRKGYRPNWDTSPSNMAKEILPKYFDKIGIKETPYTLIKGKPHLHPLALIEYGNTFFTNKFHFVDFPYLVDRVRVYADLLSKKYNRFPGDPASALFWVGANYIQITSYLNNGKQYCGIKEYNKATRRQLEDLHRYRERICRYAHVIDSHKELMGFVRMYDFV